LKRHTELPAAYPHAL